MKQAGCHWMGVDIKENADSYVFNVEIPGAAKDDIKIWLENDILTISGEKKEIGNESDKKLHSERYFGKFERSFRMPSDINGNNVKAEFVNGVLVVSVAKSEKAKAINVEIK